MIAERVGISQPSASQHLRVLRTAGLVQGEKKGYYVHYSVQPEALEQCAALVVGLGPGIRKPWGKKAARSPTARRRRAKS
jgi:ArsR family transcriptional regulator